MLNVFGPQLVALAEEAVESVGSGAWLEEVGNRRQDFEVYLIPIRFCHKVRCSAPTERNQEPRIQKHIFLPDIVANTLP